MTRRWSALIATSARNLRMAQSAGVRFSPVIETASGQSVPRVHTLDPADMVRQLAAAATGVDYRPDCAAQSLIQDGDGQSDRRSLRAAATSQATMSSLLRADLPRIPTSSRFMRLIISRPCSSPARARRAMVSEWGSRLVPSFSTWSSSRARSASIRPTRPTTIASRQSTKARSRSTRTGAGSSTKACPTSCSVMR